jgi:hypothetical protein
MGRKTSLLSTLNVETLRFSETSVLTRSTRDHIPEDNILLLNSVQILVPLIPVQCSIVRITVYFYECIMMVGFTVVGNPQVL